METLIDIVLILSGFLIFQYVGIPVHEAGHLVAGLATGYNFSLYRVLGFVWVKENGRIVRKSSKNKLIAGQCLMTPPDDVRNFRYVLYNLGGGLANLILASMCMIIAFGFDNPFVFMFFWGGAFANYLLAFMNMVPLYIVVPNDGMNAWKIWRGKTKGKGFYLLLKSNNELMQGKRYRDLDPEDLKLDPHADLSNYMDVQSVFLLSSYHYDRGEYQESISSFNSLDISTLPRYYRNTINSDLLYHAIAHAPDHEKAKALYAEKGMAKLLSSGMPSLTRILAAYEFFVLENKAKGRKLLEKAKSDLENYEVKGIVFMEQDYLRELESMMNNTDRPESEHLIPVESTIQK